MTEDTILPSLDLYILDTETAGLHGGVCEIAWLKVDSRMTVLEEFRALVNPERPIEPAAQEIHGISDADVADKPTLGELVVGKLDGPIAACAHNLQFDLRMVKPHIQAHTRLCTLQMARKYIEGTTNHKLETLQRELGLETRRSHTALDDCWTVRDLLIHIMGKTQVSLKTLIERHSKPNMLATMPYGKHKGKPMVQVPKDYREWLRSQADLDPDMRFTLDKLANI